jgi:hypothetical protein
MRLNSSFPWLLPGVFANMSRMTAIFVVLFYAGVEVSTDDHRDLSTYEHQFPTAPTSLASVSG